MRKFNFYQILLIATIILFVSCSKDDEPFIPPVESELSYASLLEEINFARTNPVEYAKLIEAMLPYYNGLYLEYPDETIYTWEGKSAAEEAIAALKSQHPVNALSLNTGLNKSAQYHCDVQGITGQVGHIGPSGETMLERIMLYGTFVGSWACGENITYGPRTARRVVIGLIIDDGVSDRGHRINIYDPNWTDVGFGWGYHSIYNIMCVMNFAFGYTAN